MSSYINDESTICALSTPPGVGGIAVIRICGSSALANVRALCSFLPVSIESHRVYFGTAKEIASREPIDELLVTYFAKGRSFTGDETIELSCHGSRAIASQLMKQLIYAGCRLARNGEFTFRAFMNGRLDLVQAESVLGLIESQSQTAARVALRQLKGHLSHDFAQIEDGLVWSLAHLEASIDFSTEDLEVVSTPELLNRLTDVERLTSRLISSYSVGRILSEGLQVALLGRPNVGKSSLLNQLLKEERAIVTATPGTTRDLVEGRLTIGGVPVCLIDTAGLRETADEIERIGIEKARKVLTQVDFVFHIFEIGRDLLPEEKDELRACFDSKGRMDANRHRWIVNKVDEETGLEPKDLSTNQRNDHSNDQNKDQHTGQYTDHHTDQKRNQNKNDRRAAIASQIMACGPSGYDWDDKIFWTSAKTGEGIGMIEQFFVEQVQTSVTESSSVVSQARHLQGLQQIHSCLVRAIALIKQNESAEFIAFELQDAVRTIHELLGKEFNEQIIDRIFKEFCLGK